MTPKMLILLLLLPVSWCQQRDFITSDFEVFSGQPFPTVTINLTECEQDAPPEYTGELGEVRGWVKQNSPSKFCPWKITVPDNLYMAVLVEVVTPCQSSIFSIRMADKPFYDPTHTLLGILSCFTAKSKVQMPFTNELHFQWTDDTIGTTHGSRFIVRYQATGESLSFKINEVLTTPRSGYVAPHGFNGERLLPNFLNITHRIQTPENYVVMLSISNGTLTESVEFKTIVNGTVVSLFKYGYLLNVRTAYEVQFQTRVFSTPVHIHISDTEEDTSAWVGFKMMFSFHEKSRAPELVHEDIVDRVTYNCSVPEWPNFRQHLDCNLLKECQDGRDEGDHCPYTSSGCGYGGVRYKNKCFAFRKKDFLETLYVFDIDVSCAKSGTRPSVLRTRREWEAVMALFRYGKLRLKNTKIGLKLCGPEMPDIYRKSFQWADGTVTYEMNSSFWAVYQSNVWMVVDSEEQYGVIRNFDLSGERGSLDLCEFPAEGAGNGSDSIGVVQFPVVRDVTALFRRTSQCLTICPQGHFIHTFLRCDPSTSCGTDTYVSRCQVPSAESETTSWTDTTQQDAVAMFVCEEDRYTVHYTLVCDFREDCPDGSDERFCARQESCSGFACNSGQCVTLELVCDFVTNCVDGSDEEGCAEFIKLNTYSLPPPAVVRFQYGGTVVQTQLNPSDPCPQTHFRCAGETAYCLPVFVRCNKVYDCPHHEDEADCQRYMCPGFYQCRHSSVCVHMEQMCDGLPHCPQQDDELMCGSVCPEGCICHGLAFICRQPVPGANFTEAKYIDGRGSRMRASDLMGLFSLVWLSLASSGLSSTSDFKLPNLRSLDLRENNIEILNLTTLLSLPNLRILILTGNPLKSIIGEGMDLDHRNLKELHLSRTELIHFDSKTFKNFKQIQLLNISYGQLRVISTFGFRNLKNLQTVDIRGKPLRQFPPTLFSNLSKLKKLYAENYELCCTALLPASLNPSLCFAPDDEISSCDDLLRSDIYRVFLWLIASVALVGNAVSFSYRLVNQKRSLQSAFNMFVASLCLADFGMGLYLCVIGAADSIIGEHYILHEQQWTHSVACKVAGFLSLMSSEVSAFMICLITLDRFIVIRFPFRNFRFTVRSGFLACLLCWLAGLLLASVPLLPHTAHWEFYSQSGICIPLPITRKEYEGRDYSFALVIVVNFVMFLLIAAGQALIYWSVRFNMMSTDKSKKSRDLVVARRLITVVVSDFLCWFPIGMLGIMAATGVPVPGEVSVITAIFVLPLNSALNPFLYTYNVLAEKRRKSREAALLKLLESQMTSDHTT